MSARELDEARGGDGSAFLRLGSHGEEEGKGMEVGELAASWRT